MKSILKLKGPFSAALLLLLFADLSLASDLIEPTRTLQSAVKATGSLTILSEPPDLNVTLDDTPIGKTPVFLDNVISGTHTLRVKDSETTIEVKPDATLQISLFRGKFINISVAKKVPLKQHAGDLKNVEEARTSQQPPKEEQKNDLTPWEKFTNRSLKHF